MQNKCQQLYFWDPGDDLGSKNLPKWGPKSIQINEKGCLGDSCEKSMLFWHNIVPNGAKTEPKMELNLNQNWVKIEAKKKSQHLTICWWFLMIFGDIFGWFLKPLIETAKMEKPLKHVVFTRYFEGTSLQKILKIAKKLNSKSYHPKVTKSQIVSVKKSG